MKNRDPTNPNVFFTLFSLLCAPSRPYATDVLDTDRAHEITEHDLLERLTARPHDCVVECATCASDHRIDALAADVLAARPRYFLCPLCRSDLAAVAREHAQICRKR